jgi:hypothetical protein
MRGYEQAVYKEQGLLEFKRNPLIEALPELMDSGEILAKLTKTPPYDRAHRLLTARERIQHAERLRQFHQPGMGLHFLLSSCTSWCRKTPSFSGGRHLAYWMSIVLLMKALG